MAGERTRLGLVLGALVPLAAGVTACGHAPAHGPAIVRGLADGCQNPLEKKLQPITVVARQEGRLVRKATIRFTHFRLRYKLVLRPGRYSISDPLSGAPSRTVTLRPGSAVTINFPNDC